MNQQTNEEDIMVNIIPAEDAFNFFDDDGDKSVTIKDIETFLKKFEFKYNPKDVEDFIKGISNNGEEKIPKKYFEDLINENVEMTKEKKIEELYEMFKLFDKKGNGRLKVSDMEEILKNIGKDLLKDEEITILLQSCDIEGDNFIDIEDFMKMMMNL